MNLNNKNKITFLGTCKNCGDYLKANWSFCPYCKTKLESYPCLNCGEKINELMHFCPYCSNKNNFQPIDKGYDKGNDWLNNILKNNK